MKENLGVTIQLPNVATANSNVGLYKGGFSSKILVDENVFFISNPNLHISFFSYMHDP